MAQYFNDFTQYPLATKLDGGGYDFTRLAGDADWTFEVEENPLGASGRVLRLFRAQLSRPSAYWKWTAVPNTDKGEIYVEFQVDAESAARNGFVGGLSSLNADATAGYIGVDRPVSSAFMVPVIRVPATALNDGLASGSQYEWDVLRKRRVLMKWETAGENVTVSYKSWWASDSEPATWLTSTRTEHPGLGAVGIYRGYADNLASLVTFIGVGTGTDDAPRAPLGGDTTAPTLTSPTASATGATTASGSVTTNEGNGTLYSLASANATELLATVKAGSSKAVTASGVQNVSLTGLTASTSYYLHFVHTDAAGNDSAVASGAQFTTNAPSGDTTPPTLTGSVTFTSITQTSYTAAWPAGSDNVGVTGYEYQIGSTAGAWTDAGNNLSASITGRTAGTTETVYVRAYDAAGLRSTPAISGSVTLVSALAAGINVTEPLKNNTGTVLANLSGVRVAVLQAASLVSVYESAGFTTNGSGMLSTISNAAITAGQQYHVAIKLANGSVGITGLVTAS